MDSSKARPPDWLYDLWAYEPPPEMTCEFLISTTNRWIEVLMGDEKFHFRSVFSFGQLGNPRFSFREELNRLEEKLKFACENNAVGYF